jgi:hypothetical protein
MSTRMRRIIWAEHAEEVAAILPTDGHPSRAASGRLH